MSTDFNQTPYLTRALNWASIDALANTPDHVLAEKLEGCPALDAMFRAYVESTRAERDRQVAEQALRDAADALLAYSAETYWRDDSGFHAHRRSAAQDTADWLRARATTDDREAVAEVIHDAIDADLPADPTRAELQRACLRAADAVIALASRPTTPTPTVSEAQIGDETQRRYDWHNSGDDDAVRSAEDFEAGVRWLAAALGVATTTDGGEE